MHHIMWVLGVLGFVVAGAADAGVVRFDLPEVIGDYSYDAFTAVSPGREAQIHTPWSPAQPEWVELVFVGVVTPAVLRGDGVIVPAGDVPLLGMVGCGHMRGYDLEQWITGGAIRSGPFELHQGFGQPFYIEAPEPAPDAPPWLFEPVFTVGIAAAPWASHLPGRLAPPGPFETTNWYDGFTMISPLTARITEAYVLVHGAAIPEPAALGVLLLGGLALLRRRRR